MSLGAGCKRKLNIPRPRKEPNKRANMLRGKKGKSHMKARSRYQINKAGRLFDV